MIGLYTPGESPLHRIGPGWKLLGLLAISIGLISAPSPQIIAGIGLAVVSLWRVARLPLSALSADLKPVLWFGAAIMVFHMLAGQYANGILAVTRFAILIMSAMLLTRTTPLAQLLAILERVASPLRVFRIQPERIAFFVVLVIRLVPVMTQIVQQVREANAARGGALSLRAVVLPAVNRTVLYAGHLGEALDARGFAEDGK